MCGGEETGDDDDMSADLKALPRAVDKGLLLGWACRVREPMWKQEELLAVHRAWLFSPGKSNLEVNPKFQQILGNTGSVLSELVHSS